MKKLVLFFGLVGCLTFGQQEPADLDFSKMRMVDVNFDGYKDLLIPSKIHNMKGETGFDVYVSTKSGRLIFSKDLSDIFNGEIYLDKRTKRIYVYSYYNASGYSWQIFQVLYRKPLKKLDEFLPIGFLHSGDERCHTLPYKDDTVIIPNNLVSVTDYLYKN